MAGDSCPDCGHRVSKGASYCPHCGARIGPGVSRAWVLSFFIMGIMLGLMVLILQQQGTPAWLTMSPPQADSAKSRPHTQTAAADRKRSGRTVVSRPKPGPPTQTAEAPPPPATEPSVVETPSGAASNSATIEPMNCDHKAAEAVRDKARTLSTITQRAGTLQLTLTRQWEYFSPGHRQSFVETFAEADLCLYGRPRVIRFNYRGEAVAEVSAEGAVQMK